jgi:hypothetical protein
MSQNSTTPLDHVTPTTVDLDIGAIVARTARAASAVRASWDRPNGWISAYVADVTKLLAALEASAHTPPGTTASVFASYQDALGHQLENNTTLNNRVLQLETELVNQRMLLIELSQSPLLAIDPDGHGLTPDAAQLKLAIDRALSRTVLVPTAAQSQDPD